MITRDSIDQVITAADIVEVVGDFVPLKKRGVNYIGLCPFHDEKTPSFNVNPARGIFKCFGCGKGGDPVDFVMEHEKYAFPEAIRYLAQKYGIELQETPGTQEDEEQKDERENLFALNEYARDFFVRELHDSEEGKQIGLSYFKERGFREEIIRQFQLGYAAGQWDNFTKSALKDSFRQEYLAATGLSIENEEKGTVYDRFRGRVIFPIHNLTGRVIGFGGRILKTEKKAAKYVNSPESLIYHKSETLYGIFFSKNKIRELDSCFLVEGYTDVISLHQSGIQNVVASSGTSLTTGQIRLIRRYTKNITMLYDGDPAGIRASMRGIDMILEEGMNVKIVAFPDGHDPDSYVRSVGGQACTDYIRENQRDFILFKAGLLQEEAGSDPLKRAEAIRQIVESIAKIPDSIKASVFIAETGRVLEIDEQALLTELNKLKIKTAREKSRRDQRDGTARRDARYKASPPGVPGTVPDSTPDTLPREGQAAGEFLTDRDIQEKEVLRLILSYGNETLEGDYTITHFLLDHLADVEFHSPAVQGVLEEIRDQVKDRGQVDPAFFIHHPREPVRKLTASLLTTPYSLSENWNKMHQIIVPAEPDVLQFQIINTIYHLKLRKVEEMISRNQEKLKAAQSPEDQETLQTEHIRLTAIKQQLSQELGTVILK